MKHLEHFSWFKPAIEDFHFERDAKELHIKQRIIDLTGGGTGILKEVGDELEAYVTDPLQFAYIKVKTGEAYIQGEKIEIEGEQTVNLDDVQTEANILWLKYKLVDSSDPDAIRQHSITGAPYVVWKDDSFELGATKESLYIVSSDKMKLARCAKIGGELKITHDYREWLRIAGDVMANYVNESDFYVGGPEGSGTKLLKQNPAPPVPTHLDLTTGWDDVFRKTGASAGLVSHRPAYIKAEFGDKGQGTASANTFTKTSNRIGDWQTNEWADYYLVCADGNSWKVVSNTSDTLLLETGATPVNGAFHLGPDAAGYKFVIETLDPSTEVVVAAGEAEAQALASPVKMEFIWHGLTADVKYRIRVASKGGWFQQEWSDFSPPEEIIAGGPKEIPDSCAEILDGEPTITADDDGIRISWSVKSEYADKVSGFELCWTDDGTSTPDFSNKNHRKIFTDRDFIVLPAKMSSDETTVTVKTKMRAVDKAGRHCITPKTLTDKEAKKYPADLADLVTDRKNILEPGGFPTLKDFISKAINLTDGRVKGITEVESYMAELSAGYSTPSKRMEAILEAAVEWAYVRIIAKSGGHYPSLLAAINELPSDKKNPYTLFMMPGIYNEGEINLTGKEFSLNIIGLQNVVVKGNIIRSTGSPWLPVENIENIMWITETAKDCIDIAIDEITSYRKTIRFKDCIFLQKYNAAQKVLDVIGYIYNVIIDHCYMELTQGLSDNVVELGGATGATLKLWLLNNSVLKNKSASGVVDGLLQCEGSNWDAYCFDTVFCGHTSTPCIYTDVASTYLKMSGCRYIGAPSWVGTKDFGLVHNVTNVQFDVTGDLDVPKPWEEIVT